MTYVLVDNGIRCPWIEAGPKDERGRRIVMCDHCKRTLPNPTAAILPHGIAGCLLPLQPQHPRGPGLHLHILLEQLGQQPKAGCNCPLRIVEMNAWGIEGCRQNRETIIGWLKEAYEESTLADRMRARVAAVSSGIAWQIDWSDPFDWLVDEAIRRAESDLKTI